jgi:tetratricopeptide (TPR) repeat protein
MRASRVAVCLAFAVASIGASPALAQQGREDTDFWERVVTPHAPKIAKLRAEATQLKNRANMYYDAHQVGEKMKYLGQALEKLEQAAKLAPDRADVVQEYADCAHDAGEHDKAIDAYARVLALKPDGPHVDLPRRLALSYIKTLRFEEAAEVLERALGDEGGLDRATALGMLGYVYMAQGRLEDAIDAYTRASMATRSPYYGGGGDVYALTGLAVAYDRDEQIERSLEVLEQVRGLDPAFTHLVASYGYNYGYSTIPFSPPSDRHYWLALAYEAQKKWSEAKVEWRAYLESHEPMYKRRAEEHLEIVTQELERKTRPQDRTKTKGKRRTQK